MTRREAVALVAVIAAVAAAGAVALGNGFAYDDVFVIEEGGTIHDPANLPRVFSRSTMYASSRYAGEEAYTINTYRPLTIVTLMVDAMLSGRRPFGYHLTNLLLHLACTALVFFVARELLHPDRRAWASVAAALFGLAPYPAEAHAWINGRSDPLCTLFGLAAVLAQRRAAAGSRIGPIFASAFLFFLGLLSKETLLFVLPALVLWPSRPADGHDRILFDRPARRLALVSPLVGAAAVYVALRAAALGGAHVAGSASDLAMALARIPVLVLDGLRSCVAPAEIYLRSLHHEYAGLPLAPFAVAFVLLAGVVVVFRRRIGLLPWALGWFCLGLAPASVISTVTWPGFGRYLYLPWTMLAVAIADVLASVRERWPRLRTAIAAGLLVYLGLMGVRQALFALDWENDDTLYAAAIRAAPESPHGYGLLGLSLSRRGRPAEAVGPLARAAALDPGDAGVARALADALLRADRCGEAVAVAEDGARRFAPSGDFRMIAIDCLNGVDVEATARHLAACLDEEPGRPDCLAALRHAMSAHPRAVEYRAAVRSLVETGAHPSLAHALESSLETREPGR